MAKGAVGVLAGYWPENIPRYLQVPALALDEAVVARPGRRRPDAAALIAGGAVTYGELAQEVDAMAAAIRTGESTGTDEGSAHSFLVQLFAAVRAGARVVVEDVGLAASIRPGARLRILPPVVAAGARPTRVGRAEPVLAYASGTATVLHSSASLLAWGVSWSGFLALTAEQTFLTLEPPHRWAGLTAALATLFRGGTCLFATTLTADELGDQIDEHHPSYVLASFDDAARLADARSERLRRSLRRSVQAIFVSLEARFNVRRRRSVESSLGIPVLTVLGSRETGPVLAAHPEWYIDEAVGLPVTNVELWPLDPRTSRPLAVPWEAIDHAEIGVRSPMLALAQPDKTDAHAHAADTWHGLGQVGLMDATGLFYLYPWR